MSTGKVASYAWYPRDYLADTELFTLEEHGAYRLLLDHQWGQGSVPTDPIGLARLLRVTPAKAKRLWTTLAAKFPGGVNGRLERERIKAEARMERAIESGRLGAEVKRKMKEAKEGTGQGASSNPSSPPNRNPHASVSVSVSVPNRPSVRTGKPTAVGDLTAGVLKTLGAA